MRRRRRCARLGTLVGFFASSAFWPAAPAALAGLAWPTRPAAEPRADEILASLERPPRAEGAWQLAAAGGGGGAADYQVAASGDGWSVASAAGRSVACAGREARVLPDRLEVMPSQFAGRAWAGDARLLTLFVANLRPRAFLAEMSELAVAEDVDVDGVRCARLRGPSYDLYYDPARNAFVRLAGGGGSDVRVTRWGGGGGGGGGGEGGAWPAELAEARAGGPAAAGAPPRVLRALAFDRDGGPGAVAQARDAAARLPFFVHPVEALPKEVKPQEAVVAGDGGDLSSRVALLELSLRKGLVAEALAEWDRVDRAAGVGEADRALLLDWVARTYMPPNDKVAIDTPERRAAWAAFLGRLAGVTRPYRGNADRAIHAFEQLLAHEDARRALEPATPRLVDAWASSTDPGTVERLIHCANAHPDVRDLIFKSLEQWAATEVRGAYAESPVAAQIYTAIKRQEWDRASSLLRSVRWGAAADEGSRATVQTLLELIDARRRVEAGDQAATAAAVATAAAAYEPDMSVGRAGAGAIANALATDVALAAIRRSADGIPAVVAAAGDAPAAAAYLAEVLRRTANDSLLSDGVNLRPELPGDRLDWAERLLEATAAKGIGDAGWQAEALLAIHGSRALAKLEPRPMARLPYLDRALAAASSDAERLPVLLAYHKTFEKAREFGQGAELLAQLGERTADPAARRRVEELAAALRSGQASAAEWERQRQAEVERERLQGRVERLRRQVEQARSASRPPAVIAGLEQSQREAEAELAAAGQAVQPAR